MPGKTLAHFHYPFPFRLSPNCSLFASRLLSFPLSLSLPRIGKRFCAQIGNVIFIDIAQCDCDCRLPIADWRLHCRLHFKVFVQAVPPCQLTSQIGHQWVRLTHTSMPKIPHCIHCVPRNGVAICARNNWFACRQLCCTIQLGAGHQLSSFWTGSIWLNVHK